MKIRKTIDDADNTKIKEVLYEFWKLFVTRNVLESFVESQLGMAIGTGRKLRIPSPSHYFI